MENIKTIDELNKLISENDKVVVKFGAAWCAPCKMIEETLLSLEKENPEIKFAHIDVDDCDENVVEEYSIMSVPTTIVFERGARVCRETGNVSKTVLKEKLGI